MQKSESSPRKNRSIPLCSTHKGQEYTHMCYEPECHNNLLCRNCMVDQHQSVHQKFIFNFEDYMKELKNQPLDEAKEPIDSLNKLLSTQSTIIDKARESQENSEREILDYFDELKFEINKILDLAYEKEVKKFRRYHERQVNKLSKEFLVAEKLVKLHAALVQSDFDKLREEVQFQDLANILGIVHRCSSLSVSMKLQLKAFDDLLNDQTENQLMKVELGKLNIKKKELSEAIVDKFGIQEAHKKANCSDSTKCGSANATKGRGSLHENQILSLAVINAEQIATAGFDRLVKLWDLKNGECYLQLSGHHSAIWDLKSGFDGKYLFSASEDTDVRVWNIQQQKCKKVMSAHKAPVTSLCIISPKKMMVSGSKEGVLLVWDLNDKKVKYELDGHNSTITAIRYFTKDQIVSAADDGYLKVWNIKVGGLVRSIPASEGSLTCLSYIPKSQRFVTGDSAGVLTVWDIEQGKQLLSIAAHKKGVCAAAVSEDGTLIASGGGDKAFKLWDLSTGSLLKQLEENESSIQCLEFLETVSVLYCDMNPKKYKFSKWSPQS